MAFLVKQQHFEGPLELLLNLIEKRKLFVNDIALAKVADDYIEHIKTFEKFPLGESAHFILIASTLLLIKSKSLLPVLSLTEEEEQGIFDLETRLLIYATIRNATLHTKKRFGETILFQPSKDRPVTQVFSPDPHITKESLAAAMHTVLHSLPKKESVPKAVVRKILSLEEVMDSLTTRVTQGLKMSFREFTATHKHEKINVIVSFLAMLELIKQGMIEATQEISNQSLHGDIHMETNDVGVPRYY